MGHGVRISRIATWLPVAFVGCGGLLLVGCGESEQAARGQPFMEDANPIVSDICNLRFEQECMRFSDTVEECRVEMLTTVGAQARFNGNGAACEATLFDLLDAPERAGVSLTSSYAMTPPASVSGLYFAHPDSHYFALGKIEQDQVEDYARRKGWDLQTAERWLGPVLNYNPNRELLSKAS